MKQLSSIGGFMLAAGVISALLSFIGYELRILMWIEMWGTGMAWVIRGGLVVVGGGLMALPALAGGGSGPSTGSTGSPDASG